MKARLLHPPSRDDVHGDEADTGRGYPQSGLDGADNCILSLFEFRDEVGPDEPRCPGYDDLHANSISHQYEEICCAELFVYFIVF